MKASTVRMTDLTTVNECYDAIDAIMANPINYQDADEYLFTGEPMKTMFKTAEKKIAAIMKRTDRLKEDAQAERAEQAELAATEEQDEPEVVAEQTEPEAVTEQPEPAHDFPIRLKTTEQFLDRLAKALDDYADDYGYQLACRHKTVIEVRDEQEFQRLASVLTGPAIAKLGSGRQARYWADKLKAA